MTAPSPQELAATVRAGIARERQQAQAATPGPWVAESHFTSRDDPSDDGCHLFGGGVPGSSEEHLLAVTTPFTNERCHADAAHIATHDPARVLADCDRAEADLAAWEAVVRRHAPMDGSEHDLCACGWEYDECPDRLAALDALARLAATYGGEG